MSYAFYRSLTIDHTKVGSTLTDFPVKVAGTVADLKASGSGGECLTAFDMAWFSDAALTIPLKFERVVYVSTTGQVVFYVKVPSVSNAVDTVIYLGFADASVITDQQDAANTWDANFKAVFHLGDGTTLSLADSTGNGNTLTNNNAATAVAGADGQGAVHFNGTNQSLTRTTSSITGEPATIEVLHKPTGNGASGVAIGMGVNSAGIRFEVIKRLLTGGINVHRMNTAGINVDFNTNAAYTVGAWNYAYVSGSTINQRSGNANGGTIKSDTTAGSSSTIDRISLGARNNSTISNFYDGDVGEARYSNIVRSTDWLEATRENLINNATFSTLGAKTSTATSGQGRLLSSSRNMAIAGA